MAKHEAASLSKMRVAFTAAGIFLYHFSAPLCMAIVAHDYVMKPLYKTPPAICSAQKLK